MDEKLKTIKFIIDTNILLEYLLDQEKSSDCETFLRFVRFMNGEAVISRFSLISLSIICSYKKISPQKNQHYIDVLKHERNIKIEDFELDDIAYISTIAIDKNLDFDDAIIYSLAQKYSCPIISFDKDFDKTDLKRLEPQEFLNL